jgi:hypothetical protein
VPQSAGQAEQSSLASQVPSPQPALVTGGQPPPSAGRTQLCWQQIRPEAQVEPPQVCSQRPSTQVRPGAQITPEQGSPFPGDPGHPDPLASSSRPPKSPNDLMVTSLILA